MLAQIRSRGSGVARLGVGVALIVGLVLVTAFVFTGGVQSLLAPSGQTVTAVFSNTGLLAPGMPVRVNGVDEGQVTAVNLNPGAAGSTVTMTVYDDALPLYRDATAAIAFRNALGGNYAIEIGRARARRRGRKY